MTLKRLRYFFDRGERQSLSRAWSGCIQQTLMRGAPWVIFILLPCVAYARRLIADCRILKLSSKDVNQPSGKWGPPSSAHKEENRLIFRAQMLAHRSGKNVSNYSFIANRLLVDMLASQLPQINQKLYHLGE